MDAIVFFVVNSKEALKFGLNASTFWAIGAGMMTFIQGYGTYNLSRSIYQSESGKGVSLYMLGYWHALLWCFLYYAWRTNSITLMFNGMVLAPLYSIALFGFLRYEGVSFARLIKITVPLLLIPLLFAVAPQIDVLLLVLMALGLVFFLDQTRLLYVEKRVGSFDPRFTLAILIASIFWFFFAISVGDFALTMINPVILCISLITLHAYVRAKRYEQLIGI